MNRVDGSQKKRKENKRKEGKKGRKVFP